MNTPPDSIASSQSTAQKWRRRLGVAAIILTVLFFVIPWIAASIVKGRILSAAREAGYADEVEGSLSLGWSGKARLSDFALTKTGQDVFRVAQAEFDASVLGLLRGRLSLEGEIKQVKIVLPRLQSGAPSSGGADESSVGREAGEPNSEAIGALPDIELDLNLHDVTVWVDGPGGLEKLHRLDTQVRIDRWDEPLELLLEVDESNSLKVSGRFASESPVGFLGFKGEVKANLAGLDLSYLERLELPPLRFRGEATYSIQPELDWSGQGRFTSEIGSDPWEIDLDLARVGDRLEQRAQLRASEERRVEISIAADTALLQSELGWIDWNLAATGEIAAWLLPFRESIGLKPGVNLGGKLDLSSTGRLQLSPKLELLAAEGATRSKVANASYSVDGRRTQLATPPQASAQVRLSSAGLVEVSELLVEASSLAIEGRAGFSLDETQFAKSDLRYRADLEGLRPHLNALLASPPQVAGRLIGLIESSPSADRSDSIEMRSETRFRDFRFETEALAVVAIDETLLVRSLLVRDPAREGELQIEEGRVDGLGLTATLTGRIGYANEQYELDLAGQFDPVVTRAWRLPLEVDGRNIAFEVDLETQGEQVELLAQSSADRLLISQKAVPLLDDEKIDLRIELRQSPNSETPAHLLVDYQSPALTLEATGSGANPFELNGQLSGTLGGVVQASPKLRDQLPAALHEGPFETDIKIKVYPEEIEVELPTKISNLEVVGSAGRNRFRETELRLLSKLKLTPGRRLLQATGRIDGNQIKSDLEFLWQYEEGSFGIEGQSEVKADLVKTLLNWKALNWTGSDAVKVSLDLDGSTEFDHWTDLVGGLIGRFESELAPVTLYGVELSGPIQTEFRDRIATLNAPLRVAGGEFLSRGQFDFTRQPTAKSTLKLQLTEIGASGLNSEWLKLLHPFLELLRGATDARLGGRLSGSLDLEFDGLIDETLDRLEPLRKLPLSGIAHIEVDQFTVSGSQFLNQLFEILEVEDTQNVDLNPIDFRLSRGRIEHTTPMQLVLDGNKTFWTGSIGLDESVDMVWQIPITDRLRRKISILKKTDLKELRVPVQGSLRRPEIRWAQAIQGLTVDLVRDPVRELFSDEDRARDLLERADAAYRRGDREAARKLYREIREKYRKTLTYRLARDRIKRRGE